MNFASYLLSAPPVVEKPRREYGRLSATKPNRLRLYLEGEKRTTNELAELLGVPRVNVYSLLKTLENQGKVKRAGQMEGTGFNGSGNKQILWTWR